jgi:hypothetical protein
LGMYTIPYFYMAEKCSSPPHGTEIREYPTHLGHLMRGRDRFA